MISTAEALETALAPAAEAPKATEKASVAKRARNDAPKKAKSGKKASPAKKAPKGAKIVSTKAEDGERSYSVKA